MPPVNTAKGSLAMSCTSCSSLFYSLTASVLFIVYLLIKFCRNRFAPVRYPPSPLALPIIGHLYLLESKLPVSFQTLARRHGPLITLRICTTSFIIASTAKVAKEILKTNDVDFASRFEMGPVQYNIYKDSGFFSGPYNSYWRFMKRLCMTKLFVGAQLERFNNIREQEIMNLLKSLRKASAEGEPCHLGMALTTLANNLICKMIMSKRFSKNENAAKEIRKMIVDIMAVVGRFGVNEVFGVLKHIDLFGNGRKLNAMLRQYDDLVEQIMTDYEDNKVMGALPDKEKDLMDILLETYNDTDAELKMTRDQIKYFLLELFIASIDTTSAAIQWAMAELINRPPVFQKLREEIDSVVGSRRLLKESDVPSLPYLQAVIKETLRLHTPAPIIHRECTKDCEISGFQVKAKSKILINAYAVMRDPDEWNDPDEYIPERFLVNSTQYAAQPQIEIKGQDFRFLPFGGGRRGCLGVQHAYIVMQATVGTLVQCFDWRVKGGEKIDITVASGYSGAMGPNLVCYPIKRLDPF